MTIQLLFVPTSECVVVLGKYPNLGTLALAIIRLVHDKDLHLFLPYERRVGLYLSLRRYVFIYPTGSRRFALRRHFHQIRAFAVAWHLSARKPHPLAGQST